MRTRVNTSSEPRRSAVTAATDPFSENCTASNLLIGLAVDALNLVIADAERIAQDRAEAKAPFDEVSMKRGVLRNRITQTLEELEFTSGVLCHDNLFLKARGLKR